MKNRKFPKYIIESQNNIKSGNQKLRFEWFQTESFPSQWVLQAIISGLNHPVGLLWADFDLNKSVGISNIYVSEDYRRCGIATRLLNKVWDWLDNDGLKMIHTGKFNDKSGPWGNKCGFRKDNIIGYKLLRKDWLKSESFKSIS